MGYSDELSKKKKKKEKLLKKKRKAVSPDEKAKYDSQIVELNAEMDEILDDEGILDADEGPKF